MKSTRLQWAVFITGLKEVLYLITVLLLLIMSLFVLKIYNTSIILYNKHIENNSLNMKFTAKIYSKLVEDISVAFILNLFETSIFAS